MFLFKYCVVLYLVIECICISEDYYDELNAKMTAVSPENVDARRVGDKKRKSSLLIKDLLKKWQYSDYSDNDDEFKIVVVNSKKKLKFPQTVSTTMETTTAPTTTTIQYVPETSKCTNKPIVLDFNKDYEYIYDDSTSHLPHHTNMSLKKTTTATHTILISEKNDSKIYYTDFFNLVPAAVMPDFNISHLPKKEWFVPETYPCWQLPVLTGELGSRKKTSEIFLTYGANLKNVVVLEKFKKPSWPAFDLNTAALHNKWCEVEPCYGDHTLCLFSGHVISKICDQGYRVKELTMLEEIAVSNTINSMRNRIASDEAEEYRHLPPASNMKQMLYDYDLEKMASAWLHQCLPGPPPCSALDGQYVTQLECTKYADQCCINSYKVDSTYKCVPKDECFVPAVIGCVHAWYLSAGKNLQRKDVDCGHVDVSTYNTAQMIWATTNKVGCAYGVRPNGDVRVVCNFAPGAPYFILTKYYCGFISHKDITEEVADKEMDFTSLALLSSIGLNLNRFNVVDFYGKSKNDSNQNETAPQRLSEVWGTEKLAKIYTRSKLRKNLKDFSNGTRGFIAKLVTRYQFHEQSESRCDTNEPIYVVGEPGAGCVERGRRFGSLCYDFRDPTPGYRLVAVVAPVALFSLILYDLFSSVVRQANY